MNLLDAHGRFHIMEQEGRTASWPEAVMAASPVFRVTGMTAAASISGQLDDAQDDTDLIAASQHGLSLVRLGVVTDVQFHHAADEVVDAVTRLFEGAH